MRSAKTTPGLLTSKIIVVVGLPAGFQEYLKIAVSA